MIRKKQDLTSEPEETKRSCINICIIIPTLSILGKCLNKVKIHMLAERVERVSMPRVACGLDRQCWEDVEKLIEEIFFKSGITVIIYTL